MKVKMKMKMKNYITLVDGNEAIQALEKLKVKYIMLNEYLTKLQDLYQTKNEFFLLAITKTIENSSFIQITQLSRAHQLFIFFPYNQIDALHDELLNNTKIVLFPVYYEDDISNAFSKDIEQFLSVFSIPKKDDNIVLGKEDINDFFNKKTFYQCSAYKAENFDDMIKKIEKEHQLKKNILSVIVTFFINPQITIIEIIGFLEALEELFAQYGNDETTILFQTNIEEKNISDNKVIIIESVEK